MRVLDARYPEWGVAQAPDRRIQNHDDLRQASERSSHQLQG